MNEFIRSGHFTFGHFATSSYTIDFFFAAKIPFLSLHYHIILSFLHAILDLHKLVDSHLDDSIYQKFIPNFKTNFLLRNVTLSVDKVFPSNKSPTASCIHSPNAPIWALESENQIIVQKILDVSQKYPNFFNLCLRKLSQN